MPNGRRSQTTEKTSLARNTFRNCAACWPLAGSDIPIRANDIWSAPRSDSKVKLKIESAEGQTRLVELTRSVPLERVFPARRKTPIYEVLASGYGYIDLERLPLAEAHKALDALMNRPAIIFDMRGYPNGTAWELHCPRVMKWS